MFTHKVKEEIEQELARGNRARAEGYEGRARVCARRAAGLAIREFHHMNGRTGLQATAYDLLVGFKTENGLSSEGRQAVDFLLQKVDKEFHLPEKVDLLVEAQRLIAELDAWPNSTTLKDQEEDEA